MDIEELVNIVKLAINEEDINPNSSIEDVDNWDSLGHMSIVLALKENLGVELSPEEISQAISIQSIKEILEN